MNKGIRASIKGVRLTPERTDAEQRALNEQIRQSMRALAKDSKAASLTPRKVQQMLREIEAERKASRRAR